MHKRPAPKINMGDLLSTRVSSCTARRTRYGCVGASAAVGGGHGPWSAPLSVVIIVVPLYIEFLGVRLLPQNQKCSPRQTSCSDGILLPPPPLLSLDLRQTQPNFDFWLLHHSCRQW